MEEKLQDESESKPKTFKLCFVDSIELGKSNVRINKPLKIAPILTPKFYCKHEITTEFREELIKKYLEQLTVTGPREKFEKPLTENQRYGWYQIRLTDMDLSDRRLNHAKNTNVIVREHLMNYAKIRD